MKISFSMPPDVMILSTGFGQAGFNIVRSLQRLGHQVPFRDPAAPVEINFMHPDQWVWSNSSTYKIGYFPWESSELKSGWEKRFKNVDEIWVTSPLMKRWTRPYTDKPIHVYEHGVDSETWTRRKRKRQDVLRFLHHGGDANRKNGQMAVDAFRAAFGDRDDVSLTMKVTGRLQAKASDNRPVTAYNNVKVNNKIIDDHELVYLYHRHHVMVYNSSGEGFGLAPLQALITGMPTICTEAWAPYRDFLLPDLRLGSEFVDSPWPVEHPGGVYMPKFDDLVDMYRHAEKNFDRLNTLSYGQSHLVASAYEWDRVTKTAFDHILVKF